jgi:large repetitive protein
MSGSRAQLRGSGVVNGGGNYLFLLTVTDGSPDKIRIKVWNKSNGQVVFDNAPGSDDIAASPQQNIGGGVIVIRR